MVLGTWDRQWKKEKVTGEELARQRENPPEAGLISVVIPVYNTKEVFLRELMDSLKAQSYPDWEAILYDGGSDRAETAALLDRGAAEEKRFRVVHAKENRGIAGNTNAAIALAKGEYIALCDHDDVLTPDALYRMAEAIAREHPDMLYSDEDMMTENGRRHMDPHRKPDFQPETLAADNYMSHLGVIRAETLREAGGLREGYDGSQDHELYLRIAQRTRKDRARALYPVYLAEGELLGEPAHLEKCLEAGCRANMDLSPIPVTAVPVDKKIRLWYDFPRGKSTEAIIFCSDEAGCREALADLEAQAPWPNLTATLAGHGPGGAVRDAEPGGGGKRGGLPALPGCGGHAGDPALLPGADDVRPDGRGRRGYARDRGPEEPHHLRRMGRGEKRPGRPAERGGRAPGPDEQGAQRGRGQPLLHDGAAGSVRALRHPGPRAAVCLYAPRGVPLRGYGGDRPGPLRERGAARVRGPAADRRRRSGVSFLSAFFFGNFGFSRPSRPVRPFPAFPPSERSAAYL